MRVFFFSFFFLRGRHLGKSFDPRSALKEELDVGY